MEEDSRMISINELVTIPIQQTKHKYEFQELGSELTPIYGKAVWSLFYKPWVTEYKVRKAHEIAQQKGIKSFAYLVGIIKKLPF